MRPHGSVATGSISSTRIATGLKSDGLTRLSTNGAGSASARPALHSADAACVKSPARIAAVGTNAVESDGRCRLRLICSAPKKNIRLSLIGPPTVPPY